MDTILSRGLGPAGAAVQRFHRAVQSKKGRVADVALGVITSDIFHFRLAAHAKIPVIGDKGYFSRLGSRVAAATGTGVVRRHASASLLRTVSAKRKTVVFMMRLDTFTQHPWPSIGALMQVLSVPLCADTLAAFETARIFPLVVRVSAFWG